MVNHSYTKGFYQAVQNSKKLSDQFKLDYVGTEEILYGILLIPSSEASKLLAKRGVNKNNYFTRLQLTFSSSYHLKDFTPRAKGVLNEAESIAYTAKAGFVSTEHLLLAILRKRDCQASNILRKLGVDLNLLEKELSANVFNRPTVQQIIGEESGNEIEKDENVQSDVKGVKEDCPLYSLGYDLTEKARCGKLDPVIGRSKEIERIIQSLSRRTKNSPVLVGEPGVGKTAVVEGLAIEIANGSVPDTLRNKTVFALDISSLIAGTRYRGDLEQRFKDAIDYVLKDGNIILFIDEIHNITSSGNSSDNGFDLGEMLKPMLARGDIQTIGATTIDEYRKYIEPDSALERRFQVINVDAPTVDDSIMILKGLRDKYEAHHNVKIYDDAIESAVRLSDRYITDRNLPDKAIDLIDEAAAKAKLKFCYTPKEYAELTGELKNLTSEQNYALSRNDLDGAKKLENKIAILRKQIEDIADRQLDERSSSFPSINSDDIAEIISEWTDIPLTKVNEKESEKLLALEEELKERVIGQDDAVSAVSRAIKRARSGIKDPNRPIGSFIFVGPTGVGKTELSKALSETLFGDKDGLIRIDMSEYMDSNSVNKLIGAPAGYVGYEESGLLTEKVRRKPYSVVLFDEIEKASPKIFDIMLQILDDGRLTDNKGKLVDFKNTVIIMTSNVGANITAPRQSMGFTPVSYDTELNEKIYDALKKRFKPEFLNRLDDVIIFNPLTKENCGKICELLIDGLCNRLEENGITLNVATSAIDQIIEEGYDEVYGARPLKRVIQRKLEDVLSEGIISGDIVQGDKITFYVDDSGKMAYIKE